MKREAGREKKEAGREKKREAGREKKRESGRVGGGGSGWEEEEVGGLELEKRKGGWKEGGWGGRVGKSEKRREGWKEGEEEGGWEEEERQWFHTNMCMYIYTRLCFNAKAE